MCGIVGYIGEKPTKDFIIDGLKKLEYRGYDSAGAFLFNSKGYLNTIHTLALVHFQDLFLGTSQDY